MWAFTEPSRVLECFLIFLLYGAESMYNFRRGELIYVCTVSLCRKAGVPLALKNVFKQVSFNFLLWHYTHFSVLVLRGGKKKQHVGKKIYEVFSNEERIEVLFAQP